MEVIPPGTTPEPHKTVNDKASETIGDKAERFTYKISYVVPDNLNGIRKITLTDELKEVLTVIETEVLVDGTTDETLSGKVSVNTDSETEVETVGLILNAADLTPLKGKTVILSITAQIKADADLSPYTNLTIPNQAKIYLNDNPSNGKETEEVPVTLSGFVDISVEKVWEGTALDYITVYVVEAANQAAANGMDISQANAKVTLTADDQWTYTFKDLPKYDASGKEISYFVTEKLPEGYTLDVQKDISGKVILTNSETPSETPEPKKDVNGKAAHDLATLDETFTYNVRVVVPTRLQGITKFVITDELHELLQVSTDELNAYKVSVYVNGSTDADATLTDLVTVENGRNVTLDMTSEMANYKGDRIHLAIEAQLKDGITVSELDGLITADNATGSIPNKATLQLTDSPDEAIETNEVIVTPQRGDVVLTKTADGVALSDGQVAKFDLYRGIAPAGEKVNVEVLVTEEGELTVPGLLPADYYFVEIESPAGYVLDATAVPFKIVGGRTVAAQNPVEVTVDNASADQPQPEKKVDTVDALLLDTFDQTFTFTIDVPVTDTRHISSFVITDTLDEFLEFVPDSWQVNLANASGTIVREGQMLTYTASEDDIAHMSNTTVTLSFAAKVKSDLDVST